MVSKGWTYRALRLLAPRRHQSKIYTESNQSDFWRIFGDLTSMQTLAIYRRLLVRIDCEINRNGCVSQRVARYRNGLKETVGVA
jgi:hypothetical protein